MLLRRAPNTLKYVLLVYFRLHSRYCWYTWCLDTLGSKVSMYKDMYLFLQVGLETPQSRRQDPHSEKQVGWKPGVESPEGLQTSNETGISLLVW